MSFLAVIGDHTISNCRFVLRTAGVVWGVCRMAVEPRSWPRTVRDVLARQILFTGIEALGLTVLIALLAGISVVAQAQVWLSRFGQSGMLGSVLVAVIVREVGPLLVNFLVIGRSGTAMAAELASMRARREVELLEAQGLDTMGYLVLPRVTGMVVSIFGLTIILIAAALFSGFMFALALGVVTTDVSVLAGSVLGAVEPVDVLNLLAKTLVPSLITGSICCVEGLTIGGAVTEIPQAVTRAVVKSIAAVLMVSVVVSVLTYV